MKMESENLLDSGTDIQQWIQVLKSDFLPEVKVTGKQTSHTVTLNKIMDFSGFEKWWKHLG